jgi:predicted transcriptional regulator
MAQKKRFRLEKVLTEVELELMNAIWDLGECTVKDVQEALPKDRALAYTTVATMMKILEQKGALKSEKKDRAHTFEPLVSRAEYEGISLEHLKTNVFGGDPTHMVMRLIDNSDLTQKELDTIRDLLKERARR